MSTTARYRDATALWTAVTDRARTRAGHLGKPVDAVLREFVFSRFLARVFHDPGEPWVLKGGQAILSRVHDARTSKDIDLLRRTDDIQAALAALRRAVGIELDDYFRFVITSVRAAKGGQGQPGVAGYTVSIDAYCGVRKRNAFSVDLVTGSLMTAAPDVEEAGVLSVPGLIPPRLRLYPVADHVADKLCATQATYGAERDKPSSRVRDLVDLVVFARTLSVDGGELAAAILGEWIHRDLPGNAHFAPPREWEGQYPALARKTPACASYTRFADAVELVATFLAPALDHTAEGFRWNPGELRWEATGSCT